MTDWSDKPRPSYTQDLLTNIDLLKTSTYNCYLEKP